MPYQPDKDEFDAAAQTAADLDWLRSRARLHESDSNAAEDLAHDVWILTLTKGHEAKERRAWMHSVLQNESRRRTRRDHLRTRIEKTIARDEECVPSASEVASDSEQRLRMEKLLSGLADHYRTVLDLRFRESKTPSQIAEILDLPVETVRTRTRRGIVMLRTLVLS